MEQVDMGHNMDMDIQHFLNMPRPDGVLEFLPQGLVDTTTLAAHDFDVDNRTGFMPPQPPVHRLSEGWELWECLLDEAMKQKLQLGSKMDLEQEERKKSEAWRHRVQQLPVLSVSELIRSEVILRRAHHVLAWIMHFYIHSLPPSTTSIHIPKSVSLPLLRLCQQLRMPPVLTYSDNVLYNWSYKTPPTSSATGAPDLYNLRSNTLFTATRDEEEFYLTSARMEIRGVEALSLMRATMDELFVGDDIARRRVTGYLERLAVVIDELKALLMGVRDGCDPEVFYREIRPWFKGIDSAAQDQERQWIFDGIEDDASLTYPDELSGASAGQSSLIHALDIFLGVDQYSHSNANTGHTTASLPSTADSKKAFLDRMQAYMPRHHRNFLNHLSSNPRPLRAVVAASSDEPDSTDAKAFVQAYNAAVQSLKQLRDSHFVIVSLYIIGPARRERQAAAEGAAASAEKLKGTGGTDLVKFLKDVRDGTAGALIAVSPDPQS